MTTADAAALAAGRLYIASVVLFTLFSALAVVGVVAGVILILIGPHDDRVIGGFVIGSAVGSWLSVLLPCLATQAVARYIEFRSIGH